MSLKLNLFHLDSLMAIILDKYTKNEDDDSQNIHRN